MKKILLLISFAFLLSALLVLPTFADTQFSDYTLVSQQEENGSWLLPRYSRTPLYTGKQYFIDHRVTEKMYAFIYKNGSDIQGIDGNRYGIINVPVNAAVVYRFSVRDSSGYLTGFDEYTTARVYSQLLGQSIQVQSIALSSDGGDDEYIFTCTQNIPEGQYERIGIRFDTSPFDKESLSIGFFEVVEMSGFDYIPLRYDGSQVSQALGDIEAMESRADEVVANIEANTGVTPRIDFENVPADFDSSINVNAAIIAHKQDFASFATFIENVWTLPLISVLTYVALASSVLFFLLKRR